MGWLVNATLRPLYLRDTRGTHCVGGWTGYRASLDGCGKSRPHRELKSIIQWLLSVVFGAVVSKLLVWRGAEGYVSGLQDAAASLQILSSTPDQQLENHSTKYHRQQPLYKNLELLMMGIVVPETC